MLTVREFTLQDVEAAAELMAHLGYPASAGSMIRRMERICSDPGYRTWVAEYQGRVVGLVGARRVILYESDHIAVQIAALVTDPRYRGRGIGSPFGTSGNMGRTSGGRSNLSDQRQPSRTARSAPVLQAGGV